jgi:hypothetical protein
MELHIIYTETEMLLSKERFGSWREIQDLYADFKTSLGPWEHEAVVEYLASEYSGLVPPAASQVEALLGAKAPTCVLTFQ